MNRIRLLFFATMRDRAGARSLEMDIPAGLTVAGLKEKLEADLPGLKGALGSVLVSVNQEYAFDDFVLPGDSEVALFPPVSGG